MPLTCNRQESLQSAASRTGYQRDTSKHFSCVSYSASLEERPERRNHAADTQLFCERVHIQNNANRCWCEPQTADLHMPAEGMPLMSHQASTKTCHNVRTSGSRPAATCGGHTTGKPRCCLIQIQMLPTTATCVWLGREYTYAPITDTMFYCRRAVPFNAHQAQTYNVWCIGKDCNFSSAHVA